MQNQNDIFEVYSAKNKFIGIVSIPHSGEIIPQEFTPYLTDDIKALMQDVDYRVHELIDIAKLNENGITVIKSNIIRTTIDLNRSKETCLLNWKQNSKGVQVVKHEPDDKQAQLLVESYYTPYYEMLKTLINELKKHHKIASFIDLHSMPSRATAYHMKYNPNQKVIRPSFCISDRTGKTCSAKYINFITTKLKKEYPTTSVNDPYFGGYITEFVNTIENVNNIQIEISREIYMDEGNQTLKLDLVSKLKPILTDALIEQFRAFS